MTPYEIINKVVAGGLLGMLGQGIRIAVGLKKLNESNNIQAAQNKEAEPFSVSRLLISIFIGFAAGAIAIFIKQPKSDDYSTEFIMAIIATGYSGADFIEGVFNTYISKNNSTTQGPAAPAGPGQQQPSLVSDESKSPAGQVLG